ncbi:MAG: hypothetical protein EZS28_033531 [Streblomastix strix]|uniref:Uncharacterized protein n=1 Tax=Streblomastix strix TaxID=222440 RepID=A0A5J4ULF8_9EUKA|nr:MAG: hypothetical protein EZS28_033531 [Streblomastix strix]
MPYPANLGCYQTYREFSEQGRRSYMKFSPSVKDAIGINNAKKKVMCTCNDGDTFYLYEEMFSSNSTTLLSHDCNLPKERDIQSMMWKRIRFDIPQTVDEQKVLESQLSVIVIKDVNYSVQGSDEVQYSLALADHYGRTDTIPMKTFN